MGWLEWAAFAGACVALDRIFAWMERRGWIYWRGEADAAQRRAAGRPGSRGD
jgi:hypothetical protein